jgi:hypothetical protein
MNAPRILPVLRIDQLPQQDPGPAWLIEELWGASAVGLVAGHPKSGKTWLALDLALSVASGTPCLGRYAVRQPGRALVYLAEDSLEATRQRVQAMAAHRGLGLDQLDLHVISAERLRLDYDDDRAALFETVRTFQPRLLLLDPLVRLHRMNENDAVEMAELLGGLRELQKRFSTAVVVVHHTRKCGAAPGQAGQGLRGSSDLWAWSDSNLYLRRGSRHQLLVMEHRSAPAPDPVALRLADSDPQRLHLELVDGGPRQRHTDGGNGLDQRICQALAQVPVMNRAQLRAQLQVKNHSLGQALQRLQQQGRLQRTPQGWCLTHTPPSEQRAFPDPNP